MGEHRTQGLPQTERRAFENTAYDLLEKAIELGFRDVKALTTDAAWKAVNASSRYQPMVDRLRAEIN